MTDTTVQCNPTSLTDEESSLDSATFITINFGGYFTCRVTTDPDPTDDPYGSSGYTMALSNEPVLDQVIHLQADEKSPIRPHGVPELTDRIERGVRVDSVMLNGKPDRHLTKLLEGASVDLAASFLKGELNTPKFISHNNVVGSDDTMAFVLEPFQLEIKKDVPIDGVTACLAICGIDVLDPAHPEKSAIDFDQPADYARRLSYSLVTGSAAAHQAIGVYDEYGYFRDRRQWLNEQVNKLNEQIDRVTALVEASEVSRAQWDTLSQTLSQSPWAKELEARRREVEQILESSASLPDGDLDHALKTIRTVLQTQQQNCRTRLYQLEMWGDRVINKLGFQTNWAHDINCVRRADLNGGTQQNLKDLLKGEIITEQPWNIDYWFGGWDGDLLTGYMQGSLQIPFKPSA